MSDNSSQDKMVELFYPAYDAKSEAENNTFGRRLAAARRQKGLSLKAMVTELSRYNIAIQPAGVSKWEQGLTTPNPYQLFALCRILDIEDGIRYFSGPLHPGEVPLNEAGLQKMEEYKKDLIGTGKYSCSDEDEPSEERILRPVYDLPVPDGSGTFLDADECQTESFRVGTVPDKADFGLIVSGNSMMPNYMDGQLVWVQKTSELLTNEIGVFILNGSVRMKMYTEAEPDEDELEDYRLSDGSVGKKIVLVSLNESYCPISVGISDNLCIVGKVLTK